MNIFVRQAILYFSLSLIFTPLAAEAKTKKIPAKTTTAIHEAPFLIAEAPIILAGSAARFDFMEVDTVNDRLLAAHSDAGSLALLDLKTGNELPALEIGHVMGVAIDHESGTYILGDADEHKVVFIDLKTLKKIGETLVSGPVDAIAFNNKNGLAYAGEDDGNHVWIIDVKTKKLVSTLEIPGVPEVIAYDPIRDRLYQNIKNKNLVSVINPKVNEVEVNWTTAPVSSPHGLAIDSSTGRLFIAGHNGNLIALDMKTGKLISQVEIAPGTDQITFDEKDRIVYCASKGFISAAQETGKGLVSLANSVSPNGAHTLAVDPLRHEVWISFADKNHSYLQKYKKNSATAEKL